MALEHQNWKTVASKLKADRLRLHSVLSNWQDGKTSGLYLHPSFICVLLYRISHHFFLNGHLTIARFIGHLNEVLTGADISPAADIDEGFVVLSPPGTAIYGKAGRNLTLMPCSGMGGEIGRREDVGAGPGLPVLGDDVVLEPHCGVLGPVRVGNRVRVGASIPLTKDVPDDTVVEGPRPRFVPRRHWS